MALRKTLSLKHAPSDRFLRLGDRLEATSRRRLWGRERELALFQSALTDRSAPFSVLYVYGLGGVGKSALLGECAREAARAGMLTVRLDGRSIEASPGGFVHALADALGLGDPDAALERLSHESAIVLTIDSYDSLTPLDPWLRESFLPRLPSRWRRRHRGTQAAAGGLDVRSRAGDHLPALPLEEPARRREPGSAVRAGVPMDQHAAVLQFTHGHPLALVLVADVIASAGAGAVFNPENAPTSSASFSSG